MMEFVEHELITSTCNHCGISYLLAHSTQKHINKSKDHYHAEDQDRHRLEVTLTRMEARKNTHKQTASALVPDCLKHVQTLNRGDSRQKED